MSEIEKLTTKMGELVNMEIPEVKGIEYSNKREEEITSFEVTMINGNNYIVSVNAA